MGEPEDGGEERRRVRNRKEREGVKRERGEGNGREEREKGKRERKKGEVREGKGGVGEQEGIDEISMEKRRPRARGRSAIPFAVHTLGS